MEDLGVRAAGKIRSGLSIDRRWSVDEPRGFAWWGHRLRQRVWADAAEEADGLRAWRVHVETDFLASTDAPRTLSVAPLATQSALVRDPATGASAWHAAMHVHAENVAWAERLLMGVAGLQIAQAESFAVAFAAAGETLRATAHPTSGARAEPDEIVTAMLPFYASKSTEEPFLQEDELAEIAEIFEPYGLTTWDRTGLTTELPFRDETALLQLELTPRHPVLGSGMLLRLSLPCEWDAPIETALRFAAIERDEGPLPLLGAWCDGGGRPVYCTFVPSAMASVGRGLGAFYAVSTAARARWIEEHGRITVGEPGPG